jgi:3-hydroxymyristoyl/3-hydroxydecanoyl-(acyl carrier protein) dehydratase
MQSAITNAIKSTTMSGDGSSIEALFSFSAADPIFNGHFPGMPVVPAVYQLGLCRKVIEQKISCSFRGISKSRFSKRCVPEILYSLKISLIKKDNMIEAACSITNTPEKALCSKLHLLFNA